MPHPKYTLEYRKQISSKFGKDKQLPQQIIDYIHEMAEVGGSDEDIRVSILDHFDSMAQVKSKNSKLLGYNVSLASIFKYARDARDVIKGKDKSKKLFTEKEHKYSRVIELSQLGLKPYQIFLRMKKQGFKVSRTFIRNSLQELSIKQLPSPEQVQEKAGVVEEDPLVVDEQVITDSTYRESTGNSIGSSSLVQIYQDGLDKLASVRIFCDELQPALEEALETAKKISSIDSILEELTFFRSGMEIPNSLLEIQRIEQEQKMLTIVASQNPEVQARLQEYNEAQRLRMATLANQAVNTANAGEKSLNE